MGLLDMKDTLAENLPHGMQRHLEIAIAMASDPELLLLDEPTAGMTQDETERMMALINDKSILTRYLHAAIDYMNEH